MFALFWLAFVTTPGPNAVNCIQNGMALGFWRAVPGVLAILTQASAFLLLSALGVTALIVASPSGFLVAKIIGAGFLFWQGVRGWLRSRDPAPTTHQPAAHVYLNALAIATINPKSVAGYLAAFSVFVQPDVSIWAQMLVIVPTALTLTTLSYCGFTLLGVVLGRSALVAVFNVWVRRVLASCFILYGAALLFSAVPQKG
ncbi:MAG: LysE family translocator [Pseudomonadota bacterium]